MKVQELDVDELRIRLRINLLWIEGRSGVRGAGRDWKEVGVYIEGEGV